MKTAMLAAFAALLLFGAASDAWAQVGRIETFHFASRNVADPVEVETYFPAGARPGEKLPVVLILASEAYFEPRIGLHEKLDAAMGLSLPRAVVVAVRMSVYREPERYARLLDRELLPALHARWPGLAAYPVKGLLGFSRGANDTLDVALQAPAVAERVALLSPGWLIYDPARQKIVENITPDAVGRIDQAPAGDYPRFWFAWGDGESEWERRSCENGAAIIAALRARGMQAEQGASASGDHGLRLLSDLLLPALDWLLTAPD
jgi:hypothetical protein